MPFTGYTDPIIRENRFDKIRSLLLRIPRDIPPLKNVLKSGGHLSLYLLNSNTSNLPFVCSRWDEISRHGQMELFPSLKCEITTPTDYCISSDYNKNEIHLFMMKAFFIVRLHTMHLKTILKKHNAEILVKPFFYDSLEKNLRIKLGDSSKNGFVGQGEWDILV